MKKAFLTVFTVLLFATASFAQQLVIHPIPNPILYSRHNDDFTVQVCQKGGEWQDFTMATRLKTYLTKTSISWSMMKMIVTIRVA